MKRILDALFQKLGANSTGERKKLLVQFVKFGLVGLLNTLVSWSIYYLTLWIHEDLYMFGSFAGTALGIANAFFWNDRFVFKGAETDRNTKLKRLGKTYVSYGGTSLLSMGLLWIEVECFGVAKFFAPIINLLVTVPLNYLINKFWTFHDERKKEGEWRE